jgi:hypothetical protein
LFVGVKIVMAPKDKRDPTWVHCHLDEEGKKYATIVGRELKVGVSIG